MGKNQKKNANRAHRQKAGTGSRMNSVRAVNSAAGTKFRRFHFLLFSAILSSLFLIYNAEFDSNSSCLDRLNNFGTISSQKLKNLPQNAISRIVGTLMCKSG